MLKNIPPILSPQLLKVLCEMGHGDRIVLADGNFPSESMGKNNTVVRCDGHGVAELLKAILEVFPLDSYVEHPVSLMAVAPGDKVETPVWDEYRKILDESDEGRGGLINYLERFSFYEATKSAYAVVATGEEALYANVMLQKGVVK